MNRIEKDFSNLIKLLEYIKPSTKKDLLVARLIRELKKIDKRSSINDLLDELYYNDPITDWTTGVLPREEAEKQGRAWYQDACTRVIKSAKEELVDRLSCF